MTAAEIRAGRKALGLTQPELGRLLGVCHVSVWGWEAGRHYPTEPHRRQLVELFGSAKASGAEVSYRSLCERLRRLIHRWRQSAPRCWDAPATRARLDDATELEALLKKEAP